MNGPESQSSISENEVSSAIRSLNKGKSQYVYNICAQYLSHGTENIVPMLTKLLSKMWNLGIVSDSLKLGVPTPVLKRKGSNLEAKHYRGITVTPILSKVLETVLSERIKVRKRAKIRNLYDQVPHLTQVTNGKVRNSQLDITNESQEVSHFPAGDHKATINRRARKHNKHLTEIT